MAKETITLRCDNLSKSFGNKRALSGVSFYLYKGKVLGILGANGSGKTVLLSCLLGLIKPDSGEIEIIGRKFDGTDIQVKKSINFAFSHQTLQLYATPMDNLLTFAQLYGISNPSTRISEYAKYLGITELVKAKSKLVNFSSGEKTKINLCKALVSRPKVLLLDEPAAFLDFSTRAILYKAIRMLVKKYETSIVITSHNLEEIASLCDSFLVLKKGRVSYFGKSKSMKLLQGKF